MNTPYTPDERVTPADLRIPVSYMAVTGLVLLLMMIAGLVMRLAQAEVITVHPEWFYRVLTLHGTGMVAIAGLAGTGIMWYFLHQYVPLSRAVAWLHLLLFVLGVAAVIVGVMVGGYAGGWTFLYPLPAFGQFVWPDWSSALFLLGLLVVGTGFLLLHIDCGRAIISTHGGLGRALGWPQLFGHNDGNAPSAAVIASTMVLIVNILGIGAGALVILLSLVNLFFPAFSVDPLFAKNLIYFFGHVFINATIYMAVIGVYHLLPRYAGRPWATSNKVFLGAWTASTLMVLTVYPHHLLMDFVNPVWLHVLGQIISYTNGLPVLVVTAYGALTLVHRSGIRWDIASGLLFLGTFGWAAGVIPAMVDATITINRVMHNTMWVPGHFHFYLLLGMIAMALGFMHWLGRTYGDTSEGRLDRAAFWLYTLGGAGFVGMFLVGGAASVPRRFASHVESWQTYDLWASGFAAVVILAVLVFLLRFFGRFRSAFSGDLVRG